MELNLSFIFGLLTTIIILFSMQFKDMRIVLICQFFVNLGGGISYILSGGFSGCGIYFVAVFQALIYLIFRLKELQPKKFIAIIFSLAYLLCSILTFKGALDIAPLIAAQLCAFSLVQKKPSNYRILILFNGIIWLLYDLLLPASLSMAASHIITIISALIGIWRLDILSKKSKKRGLI